jgi:integrase
MPSLIVKRGTKIWRATVVVNGVRKDHLFPDNTKKSYQDAVLWEKETREKLKSSKILLDSWQILKWANEYLIFAQERYAKKVFDQKRSVFARFISFLRPDMIVNDLTPSLVLEYMRKQAKNRSGYAANKDRKDLAAGWNWACKYLDGFPLDIVNPIRVVDKFPEVRMPRYVPPEKDFWAIYEIAGGQDKIMLLTYLHTAGRRMEIFNLKWDDVDFADSRIRLWTNKREQGNREFDWLPLTQELRQALLKWWEERPVKDAEYVFVCLEGNTYCADFYGKPFAYRQHFMRKLCEKACVKPFGFHAIRHLTASILYHKGYNVSVIQAILRHQNPTTTNRYLRSLGLESVRVALDEGLKGPARIIQFKQLKETNG